MCFGVSFKVSVHRGALSSRMRLCLVTMRGIFEIVTFEVVLLRRLWFIGLTQNAIIVFQLDYMRLSVRRSPSRGLLS